MAKRSSKKAAPASKARRLPARPLEAALRKGPSARAGRAKGRAATTPAEVALAAPGTRPAAPPGRLPRDPKGRRAQFYADPAIDQLWAGVTSLTAEVSVAFDRLAPTVTITDTTAGTATGPSARNAART